MFKCNAGPSRKAGVSQQCTTFATNATFATTPVLLHQKLILSLSWTELSETATRAVLDSTPPCNKLAVALVHHYDLSGHRARPRAGRGYRRDAVDGQKSSVTTGFLITR